MVIYMSMLNYIVTKLKAGVISFVNVVTLANRDYPYDDYCTVTVQTVPLMFVVGSGNKAKGSDQKKLFVSKSTLIMCTDVATVKFNNSHNVTHTLLGNVWYEFKHNIKMLIVLTIAGTGTLYAHFEGVLPDEARSPE